MGVEAHFIMLDSFCNSTVSETNLRSINLRNMSHAHAALKRLIEPEHNLLPFKGAGCSSDAEKCSERHAV